MNSLIQRLIILGVFLSSGLVQADTTKVSKIGADFRGLKSSSSLGLLLGIRYLHYVSPQFSVGGAAYTGEIAEGASGSVSYGGLMAAYSSKLTKEMGLEFSMLAGGGGGFTSTQGVGGGMTIEPNISAGFNIGHSVRASIGTGYVWVPNNGRFSGFTAGIRFDFLNGLPAPESREVASEEF